MKQFIKKLVGYRAPVLDAVKLQFDGKVETSYANTTISYEAANTFIATAIDANRPCMITRLGASELKAVNNYIVNGLSSYNNMHPEIVEELFTHSGVFPNDRILAERFCTQYIQSIKYSDLIGVWDNRGEDMLLSLLAADAKLCALGHLEPFFTEHPWTAHLKGKKVLGIHPFEKTIQRQYQKRELLFANAEMLPEFELKTIPAVQSLSGADPRFGNWFEAFEYMKAAIQKEDFDVAIIGAGSYGLPLAAYVKQLGKVAIHLGGASQLLFGIKGKRWAEREKFANLFNEHWAFPAEDEKPAAGGKVDGIGPYWS